MLVLYRKSKDTLYIIAGYLYRRIQLQLGKRVKNLFFFFFLFQQQHMDESLRILEIPSEQHYVLLNDLLGFSNTVYFTEKHMLTSVTRM